jgi:hypothetical protein
MLAAALAPRVRRWSQLWFGMISAPRVRARPARARALSPLLRPGTRLNCRARAAMLGLAEILKRAVFGSCDDGKAWRDGFWTRRLGLRVHRTTDQPQLMQLGRIAPSIFGVAQPRYRTQLWALAVRVRVED